MASFARWTLLWCLVLGGGCARGARTAPSDIVRAARLAREVDALRTASRIPGLAMVVLRDTTVLLAQGFGYADVESRRPVTAETPFNIASVSKPLSAVVALRLVQDGLLDLDRPMQRYRGFGEFCDAVRPEGGIFFGDFDCTGQALTMRRGSRCRPTGLRVRANRGFSTTQCRSRGRHARWPRWRAGRSPIWSTRWSSGMRA